MQDDVRGLGIEPEVELVARVGGELRIGGLRIETAAHEHDALGQRRELRVDGNSQRDVGQRPGSIDGDLVWMRAHLANEEVRSVFVEGLRCGKTFGHGRNLIGAVRLERSGSGGSGGRRAGSRFRLHGGHAAPRAEPRDFAHDRFHEACLFLGADEREDGAAGYGNIGVAGQLQHAQRVQGLFVAPSVTGDHGDAQHPHIRRLQQRQHGHLIGAAGAGAVLIDQNQPLLRRAHRDASQRNERQELSFHTLDFGTATRSLHPARLATRRTDH